MSKIYQLISSVQLGGANIIAFNLAEYCGKESLITAHEGGMPDMVDEGSTGFLVHRYDDAETLAARLEHLLSDLVLRKQMGANGRVKYENHFTLPLFEQRLLNILQEVI